MLKLAIEGHGHLVVEARDQGEAVRAMQHDRPALVLTDLRLPEGDGFGVLRAAKELDPELPVIVMTAYGSIQDAVAAMKEGALDFLAKPVDPDHLLLMVDRALTQRRVMTEYTLLKEELATRRGAPQIIGDAPSLRQAILALQRAAGSDATVLLEGESGTGKELFARALHALSPRSEGPFVAINCAAIPDNLLETELFGHEKGAFTSAVDRHLGCFEQADGGTLFLDEITEMALEIQPKFLRVLEEGQIRRVGGNKNIAVSVRTVAATNRPPLAAVKEGKLRQDLFYRLNVFHLELPPLRERGEDIALLAGYFLESFADKYHKSKLPWSTDFASALQAHHWPGNVRELRNAMERLTVLAPGSSLSAADLKQYCLSTVVEEASELAPMSLAEAERLAIERAMAATAGNKTQAAQLLGITPKTLNAKLALYSQE